MTRHPFFFARSLARRGAAARLALLAAAAMTAGCDGVDDKVVSGGALDATVAEGGASDASPESGTPDAGVPIDSGDLDALYPANVEAAVHRSQATTGGGDLVVAPKVVTITFASMDATLRSWLESFDDTITGTPYWSQVTSEYCSPDDGGCVGPGGSGGHVVLAEAAPATLDDTTPFAADAGGSTQLQAFLGDHILDGTLPQPTLDTVYVLYLPATTVVTALGGSQCVDWEGYHRELPSYFVGPDAAPPLRVRGVPYAIVADCGKGRDSSTLIAAHELIESTTDPFRGYRFESVTDILENNGNVTELADQCGGMAASVPPYTAQRSWSNAAVRAGHYPCVPNAGEVEFSAVVPSGGVEVAVGESATVDLVGFADVPHRPWHVEVLDLATAEVDGGLDGGPYIVGTVDDPWMFAGKTVHATVTLQRTPTTVLLGRPSAAFAIRSLADDGEHWAYGAVIQK
jgi:hypothetical protein